MEDASFMIGGPAPSIVPANDFREDIESAGKRTGVGGAAILTQNGRPRRAMVDYEERNGAVLQGERSFARSIREAERREISGDTGTVEDLESIERHILGYRDEAFPERFEAELVGLVGSVADRPLSRPVYQFPPGSEPLMEYGSANVCNYKVFHRVDEPSDRVIIYRIPHSRSDFTRVL